jgi:hypothetical protein
MIYQNEKLAPQSNNMYPSPPLPITPTPHQHSPSTKPNSGAFYALIQRVYLDLTESVRLQTLPSVQTALLADPSTASYIAGTVASTQNALAAISAHVRSVTPNGSVHDPAEHMRWVLEQDGLLAPGRDRELQACHTALLVAMSRMHMWADEKERATLPIIDETTAVTADDLDDLEEVLRSPYARRRERQARRALLEAVEETAPEVAQPAPVQWRQQPEKSNDQSLHSTTAFGRHVEAEVTHVPIVPVPLVPSPIPQGTSPHSWRRLTPVISGEHDTTESVISSYGSATHTPIAELPNDAPRTLSSAVQSTNTSPVPQHLEAGPSSLLPPQSPKPDGNLQRQLSVSSIPPPVPPKELTSGLRAISNPSSVSLVSALNQSPRSQAPDHHHSPSSWQQAAAKSASISSIGAGSDSMVSLQNTLLQGQSDNYKPGAYGAVEIDTREVPIMPESVQAAGSSYYRAQQQHQQEEEQRDQQYRYQFQPQGFRQYYQNQVPPIPEAPIPADTQYPIVVRSMSYARGVFRPAPADEHLPEVWVPGINPTPPIVDYSPATGFPSTRGYPPNQRQGNQAISSTTSDRRAQKARRAILEED